MYVKTAKRFGGKTVRVMALLVCLSLLTLPFAGSAWAAVATPVIVNADRVPYADKGQTTITDSVDVFLGNPTTPEIQWFYQLTGAYVDVFYDGKDDDPVGSYFEGSLVNGALATTITAVPDKDTGTLLRDKVTVPKLAAGQSLTLQVVGYDQSIYSDVYTHTFVGAAAITLTDGADVTYENGGKTGIDASIDVFVKAEPDTKYYYLWAGTSSTVEVYYEGESGSPVGSYFDGPQEPGALVTTIGGVPDENFGALVPSDGKITVPKPTAEQPSVLKIAAYLGGALVKEFTHTFAPKYVFARSVGEETISLRVEDNTTAALSGSLILAIYDTDGALAYADAKPFSAGAYGEATVTFDVLASVYPAGSYTYKALIWDAEYLPLLDTINW